MCLKRMLSLALAVLLTATLCVSGLSVSAATEFPDMPKGAQNLFDPDTMELLGTNKMAAVYEKDTLLLQNRVGTDPAWASLTAKFDLPDAALNAKDGFVIQFHTRIAQGTSDGSDMLFVRVADAGSNDMFGAYYDIVLTRTKASLYYGRAEKLASSLPSNNMCLSSAQDNIFFGDWKEVSLYVRKSGAGHAVTVFINREATVTADGSDSFTLDPMDLCLMFGFQNYSSPIRGLRVYAVDNTASSFEPAFKPNAEFEDIEDGTAGKDGGNAGVTLIGDEANDPQDGGNEDGGNNDDTDKPDDLDDEPQIDNETDLLPIILGAVGGVVVIAAVVVVLIVLKKRKAAPTTDTEEKNDDEKA